MAQALATPVDPLSSCLPDTLDTSAVVRHLTHELRQPLSTIETASYYLEIVMQRRDPRVAQQVERIQQMVTQMNWILSDAVHYLQAAPPRPAWVDLSEIVHTELTSDSVHRHIIMTVEESSPAPLVLVDTGQAQHLVRNVLSVFRQLIRTEGAARVHVGRLGSLTVLETHGEFAGNCTFDAEELFHPFSPHLPAGSGLALASVRRIAESHGGWAVAECRDGNLTLRAAFPALSA